MTVDMPSRSPAMTGVPASSRRLKWMWHELPSSWFSFAMNVMAICSCAAISLAPFL